MLRAALFLCLSSLTVVAAAQPRPADQPASRPFVIGYSQCNRAEPWREQMDKDIKTAAETHPRLKLIQKDAQNDRARQMAHLREFIVAKVDAIIVSPLDVSLTLNVGEAYEAGIPVIVLDRRVNGDKYTCFIGGDNRLIAREVGAWVTKQLGGKGTVVELKGLSTSPPAVERTEPFREAIKGTDIRIVYDADVEWLKDKAREKMQAALARNPRPGSIRLVYAHNDPAAIGAFEAAKDAGREKEMMFVGVDALPHEGVAAVKAGILDATFEYPNGAKQAIDIVLAIADGKLGEVPKTIILGTRLFTKENVAAGGEEIKAKP
ncbi:MAG: substrate-binding domain-containing protein [Phycisphaerales bacterium]